LKKGNRPLAPQTGLHLDFSPPFKHLHFRTV
jgi:hypothetical protein